MFYRITFTAIIISAITACSPAKNDRLIQDIDKRAQMDSVNRKEEMDTHIDIKVALSDSVTRIEKEVTALQVRLVEAKSECEVQKDKMTRIKKFKLLRTAKEREVQIREQVKTISNLESTIIQLQNLIINLQIRSDNFKREVQINSGS